MSYDEHENLPYVTNKTIRTKTTVQVIITLKKRTENTKKKCHFW